MSALRDGPSGSESAGELYTYDRSDGSWSERPVRSVSRVDPGDQFGAALDASAAGALVGTPGDDPAGTDSGSVYAFDLSAGR